MVSGKCLWMVVAVAMLPLVLVACDAREPQAGALRGWVGPAADVRVINGTASASVPYRELVAAKSVIVDVVKTRPATVEIRGESYALRSFDAASNTAVYTSPEFGVVISWTQAEDEDIGSVGIAVVPERVLVPEVE